MSQTSEGIKVKLATGGSPASESQPCVEGSQNDPTMADLPAEGPAQSSQSTNRSAIDRSLSSLSLDQRGGEETLNNRAVTTQEIQSSKPPTCFRVQSIPEAWTPEEFLGYIQAKFPSLEPYNERLSLFRSCYDTKTRTALLHLETYPEPFRNRAVHEVPGKDGKLIDLTIDRQFYGLTPLNDPPSERDIAADIVAVTGLAGHAYGSWRSRESHRMWLADHLPKQIVNARIMTYGYNSRLVEDTGDLDLLDHKKQFIQQLQNARSSKRARKRPLIFIGHSLGGILILQTLIQAKGQEHHKDIFDSTRALLLFGTPHQGLEVKAILEMINDTFPGGCSKRNLVHDLERNSKFLDTHREDITGLWGSKSEITLVSFYETQKTKTVGKNTQGTWGRVGSEEKMVTKNSAQLFWPSEHRIPVSSNHTDMVKFLSDSDSTYQTVLRYLKECVDKHKKEDTSTKEANQCLKSLRPNVDPFDYQAYRDNVLQKRHPKTCEWIQKTSEYESWLRGDGDSFSLLWLHGAPGCGKSTMAAFISTVLSIPVAYSFFVDKDEKLRAPSSTLQTLLFQVLILLPESLKHFRAEKDYELHNEKTNWSYDMLWRVFRCIVLDENRGPLCLIIDAMDECEKDSRSDFLHRLGALCGLSAIPRNIKLLITSRPHVTLSLPGVRVMELSPGLLKRDITDYVTSKVQTIAEEKRYKDELAKDVRERLLNGANGSFLWVSLVLDQLETLKSTATGKVRKELHELPKNLRDVYLKILSSIDRDYEEQAREVLRWIVFARRPLKLKELAVAIVIRPEHTSMLCLADEIEQNMEQFLTIFGPLLKIHPDDTVHLVHQSARDFLLGRLPDSEAAQDDRFLSRIWPSPDSHVRLATSCLVCLNFDELDSQIEPSSTGVYNSWVVEMMFADTMKDCPLLDYAATQWVSHILEGKNETLSPGSVDLGTCQDESINQSVDVAGAFSKLARYPKKMNLAYFLLAATTQRRLRYNRSPAIIIAVYFDDLGRASPGTDCAKPLGKLAPLVKRLIRNDIDINGQGAGKHANALQLIASRADEPVAQLLVDHGANVNAQGGQYGNALQAAVGNGNNAVAQMLVKNGADVNAQGGFYGTALCAAAVQGNTAAARILVEHRANVNAQGGKYGNALQAAVGTGNNAVAQMLIENGADVNAQGGLYGTALYAAAVQGNTVAARILVEHGANVNVQGGKYGNALQAAVGKGNNGVVQMLVENGADVNAQGGWYGDALSAAVLQGNMPALRMLAKRKASVNTRGGADINALAVAIWSKNEAVVENGADVNAQGGMYGNALHAAAWEGNEPAVRVLIENGANVNTEEGGYGNALYAAAWVGDDAVARILVQNGADVNIQGGEYGNPLQAAAWRGNTAVVRTLLDNGADVNAQGGLYGNALQAAVSEGKEEVAWILLENGADVNAKGGVYGNALQGAAWRGNEVIVRALAGHGADVNAQGGVYGNALRAAVSRGNKAVVQVLIENGANVSAYYGLYGNAPQPAAC